MNAKDHYKKQFHPQLKLSEINAKTYAYIETLKPLSIFEFGCNVGRHLTQFEDRGYTAFGIDINKRSVKKAKASGLWAEAVDESYLQDMEEGSFDLCFTNSVLCHIEKVGKIVEQLHRISTRGVIMVEAVQKQGQYYWLHKYKGEEIFELKSTQGKLYKCFHYAK